MQIPLVLLAACVLFARGAAGGGEYASLPDDAARASRTGHARGVCKDVLGTAVRACMHRGRRSH